MPKHHNPMCNAAYLNIDCFHRPPNDKYADTILWIFLHYINPQNNRSDWHLSKPNVTHFTKKFVNWLPSAITLWSRRAMISSRTLSIISVNMCAIQISTHSVSALICCVVLWIQFKYPKNDKRNQEKFSRAT